MLYRKYVKLIIDFLIVLIASPLWMPIFFICYIVVLIIDGRPVLYYGERVGKDLKLFNIIKFRTMQINAGREDSGDTVLEGDPRVTKLGLVLRKYKIDEIPQLFQIMSGKMSLVGPRPELPVYVNVKYYRISGISSLRPGITDLSSIKYRNLYSIIKSSNDSDKYIESVIIPKKNRLRRYYAKKVSFCTDMFILLKTIQKIFK
jgi:lipopolysaccharide/colanic/teichoic acid biosynthesis glycosyltransferase